MESPFDIPLVPIDSPIPIASPVSCFKPPSTFGFALGILIMIGTFITYVPQYYALWSRRSATGISLTSIATALGASCAPTLNYLYINLASKAACCSTISSRNCYIDTMDGQQLATTFICKLILNLMWLWVFNPAEIEPDSKETIASRRKFRRTAGIIVATLVSLFIVNIAIACIMNFVGHPGSAKNWIGKLIGFAGGLAVFFQWGPQIWKTWKLQDTASLSVVMLLMQFPGGLAIIYFQSVVHKSSWTTWFPYASSLVQMTVLLGLCFWIKIKDKWFKSKSEETQALTLQEDSYEKTINGSEYETTYSQHYGDTSTDDEKDSLLG